MSVLQAATKDGGVAEIEMTAVTALDEDLRGSVLLPASAGYDDARRIWNAMIDRRPAIIARCAGAADVASAVNFAREHDLLVAVRGGGHNVAGNAVCHGGLMIDLSGMRSVHLDPSAGRARAAGGATWGDFDAETQVFGLATTGGLISDTGVAGLTLGGGIGWLTPSYGLACDNLASVDLVLADGKMVAASADENSDLFWGLKGGGGNFGVATSFEFDVYPVADTEAWTPHPNRSVAHTTNALNAFVKRKTTNSTEPIAIRNRFLLPKLNVSNIELRNSFLRIRS